MQRYSQLLADGVKRAKAIPYVSTIFRPSNILFGGLVVTTLGVR
jgi:hypothetical protein